MDNQLSQTPLATPEEASPPPPGYQAPAQEAAPVIKPSPFRLVAPIIIGLIVISLLIFGGIRLYGLLAPKTNSIQSNEKIVLTYWGLWESPSVMSPVIAEFEKQNPNIKVDYQFQSSQDYQDRVRSALGGPNSPDIVRLHTTWLPIFSKSLFVAPANTVSAQEMSSNFYPIISKLLVANNQVYGIPFAADGLGLYINTSMFAQKSLDAPRTWDDLVTDAKLLKEVDPLTGKILRAGVALGNTSNVDHWSDIVSLMLLQGGVKLTDPKGKSAEEVLSFYTDFVQKHHVWDDTLPNSTIAFANGKVAMIFAPAWRASEIKQINPQLSWKVVPVPQLPNAEVVNWSSIWFEAVSKNSKHPKESWQFLSYLASAKAQQLIFESAAKEREFPQAPANKSLNDIVKNNAVVSPFVTSLDSATSFYTAGYTQDSSTGLNSRLIKYLEDAVNGFAQDQTPSTVVDTLNKGFNQVLSQYNLVAPNSNVSP